MICYIDELPISQEQKEALDKKHRELWNEVSKISEIAKTPTGNKVLVLPKNNVQKAISSLAKINKDNEALVVGRGGNIVILDKGKEVLRESIKVNVKPLMDKLTVPDTKFAKFRNSLNNNQQATLDYFVDYLKEVNPNFKIEFLNNMDDKGLVDFTTSTVYIAENSSLEDVSEEVIHVLYEMVPQEDKEVLEKNIIDTSVYRKTFNNYKNDPEYQIDGKPNISKIKKEASVKLINHIANNIPVQVYSNSKVLDIVKKVIDKILKLVGLKEANEINDLIYRILTKEQVYDKKELTDLGKFKSKYSVVQDNLLYGLTLIDGKEPSTIDLEKVTSVTIPIETLFTKNKVGDYEPNNFYFQIKDLLNDLAEVKSSNLYKIRIQTPTMEELLTNPLPLEIVEGLEPFYLLDANNIGSFYIPSGNEDYFVVPKDTKLDRKFTYVQDINSTEVYYTKGGKYGNFIDGTNVIPAKNTVQPTRDYSSSSRLKEVERIFDPISELVEKYQNILTPSQITVLRKTIERIRYNAERLEDTPIHLSKNLIKTISQITNDTEMINSLRVYLDYISSMEDGIEQISNALDNPNITIKELSSYIKVLTDWDKVITANIALGGNLNNDFLTKLKILNSKIGTLDKVGIEFGTESQPDRRTASLLSRIEHILVDKKAEQIYEELMKPYYEAQEKEVTRLIQDLKNKGVNQDLIDKRVKELVSSTPDLKKELTVENIKKYLRGAGDTIDLAQGNKIHRSIVSFFDTHMIGTSFANDPIIAHIGLWHRKMFQLSNDALRTILDRKTEINPILRQFKNEFELGKEVMVSLDSFEEEYEDQELNGVKFQVVKLVPKKVRYFANKYGDWMNKEHTLFLNFERELKVNDQVVFSINRTSLNELKLAIKNLDALVENGIFTSDEILDLREAIKINIDLISEDFLKGKYIDAYHDGIKAIKDSISSQFNISRVDLEKIINANRQVTSNVYSAIENLFTRIRSLDPIQDKDLIRDIRHDIYKLRQDLYKEPQSGTDEFIYYEWKKKNDEFSLQFKEKEIDYNTLLTNVKRFELTKEQKNILQPYLAMTSLSDAEGKNFVNTLVELHKSIISQTFNKEDIGNNEFFKFLNNTINYTGNENWNNQRKSIFNQLNDINALRFADEHLVLQNGQPIIHSKLTADDINELNLATVSNYPIVTSIEDAPKTGYCIVELGYKESVKNKNTYIEVSKKISVLAKDGKYLKSGDKNKDISDNWEKIFEIVGPYRDRNGMINLLSQEDQEKVKQLEQDIEDLKNKQESQNKIIKMSAGYFNYLKDEVKSLVEELDDLQKYFIQETYYDELRLLLEQNKTSTYFKSLIQSTNDPIDFNKHIFNQRSKLKQLYITFKFTPDFLRENPNFTQQDLNIAKWFIDNHVIGNKEIYPTYQHRKYLPTDENYFKVDLSHEFQSNVFKDSAKANNKFVTGEYLPKKGVDDESTRQYNNFSTSLREFHDKWIEGLHIANQTKIKDNNPYRIKGGFLGYRVPSMAKKHAELGPIELLKRKGEDILGVNLFEKGEISADKEDRTSIKGQWNNFKEWFLNFFSTTRFNEIPEILNDKNNSYDLRVNYTGSINEEDITYDPIDSVFEYQRSLERQNIIHNNYHEVDSTVKILETNGLKNSKGEYSRLKRIKAYVDKTIFKHGIGGTSVPENILRMIRLTMQMASQSITNIPGQIKNLVSSNIANHIRSLNVNGKWSTRRRNKIISMVKSWEWSTKVARQVNELTDKTPFELFMFQTFNPTHIIPLSYRAKDYVKSGKFWFAGNSWFEFQINTNLMLNIFDLYEFEENGNSLNFRDIWEYDNGWKIRDTVTDKNGNSIDIKELTLEIQSLMQQQVFSTTGHQTDDTGASINNPLARTLLTFMNFMNSLLLESLTTGRRDFIQKRQIRNYHIALISTLYHTLEYMIKHKENYWHMMTDGEKRDFLRGFSVYMWGFVISQIISSLFDFDDDDDDKFKKLEKNSYFTNLMLYSSIRTLSEVESQSLWNFQTHSVIPIISENAQYILKPMAGQTLAKFSKDVVVGFVKNEKFKRDDKRRGIKEGDSKSLYKLKSMLGININERMNLPYQIKTFWTYNVENMGQ